MFDIVIQRATKVTLIPSSIKLKQWAKAALKNKIKSAELTIRIVDKDEMIELNSLYRNKAYPTNVLSFPFDNPEELEDEMQILGDIAICAEVVKEEAKQQKKKEEAHWAHLVIHGTLHLLGYDHEKETDASKMEAEEIKILHSLGFSNPYLVQ